MEKMNNYLEYLAEKQIRPDVLQHALEILQAVPQIQDELENPRFPRKRKRILSRKYFREQYVNLY